MLLALRKHRCSTRASLTRKSSPRALSGSALLCNEEFQFGEQPEDIYRFKTVRWSPTWDMKRYTETCSHGPVILNFLKAEEKINTKKCEQHIEERKMSKYVNEDWYGIDHSWAAESHCFSTCIHTVWQWSAQPLQILVGKALFTTSSSLVISVTQNMKRHVLCPSKPAESREKQLGLVVVVHVHVTPLGLSWLIWPQPNRWLLSTGVRARPVPS